MSCAFHLVHTFPTHRQTTFVELDPTDIILCFGSAETDDRYRGGSSPILLLLSHVQRKSSFACTFVSASSLISKLQNRKISYDDVVVPWHRLRPRRPHPHQDHLNCDSQKAMSRGSSAARLPASACYTQHRVPWADPNSGSSKGHTGGTRLTAVCGGNE